MQPRSGPSPAGRHCSPVRRRTRHDEAKIQPDQFPRGTDTALQLRQKRRHALLVKASFDASSLSQPMRNTRYPFGQTHPELGVAIVRVKASASAMAYFRADALGLLR